MNYEERDKIALSVIADNVGSMAFLNAQMDSGEVDAETVRRLIREGIERATEEKTYEYGHKALGCNPVVDTESVVRDRNARWGDKIMRRVKAGEWEEVQ